MFQREKFRVLLERLQEPRRFIQVLIGPRQVGKTELAHQVLSQCASPHHYATADSPTLRDHAWLYEQWMIARSLLHTHPEALLVLDEVQKITDWSEIVKQLWDEDKKTKTNLKVLLLGSSPLLLQRGLTESLAGRFEIIHLMHWSYAEMHAAFGLTVEQYVFFGGYPGSAGLINDPARFANYITESLIETTISRDILLLTRIDKPALLRRLFYLCCEYSGQILSFQKMLGQLQDAGNASTLAHYLELLSGAGMVTGLQKFAGQVVRQKASSPKLHVYNTALMSGQTQYTLQTAKADASYWGRLVESVVAMHLLNAIKGTKIGLYYWREKNQEVDFILQLEKKLVAIEVKSSIKKELLSGMSAFLAQYPAAKPLLIGNGGIPLEQFLLTPVEAWL